MPDQGTRDTTDTRSVTGQPGIGVDRFGGQVVDPTKNVEDLVESKSKSDRQLREADQRFLDANLEATNKLQDFAREAEAKFQNFARDKSEQYLKSITDGETRRIDQLAETRQEFQNTIRDMLAESVRTTSTLVSTQLVQIQATFDARVSKLEAQAFMAAGRSSVADPQIENAITRISQGMTTLSTQTSDALSKMASGNTEAMSKLAATVTMMQTTEARSIGQQTGVGMSISAIVQIVASLGVFATVLIAAIAFFTYNKTGPEPKWSLPKPELQRQLAPIPPPRLTFGLRAAWFD